MATYTPKLGLKKPDGTDYVLIGDLNQNMDKLEQVIGDPAALNAENDVTLVDAINEAILRGGENAPYIDYATNTWWMWDFRTFQYVDTGVPATGPAAGFDIPTASATGLPEGSMPTVAVSASGPDMAKIFDFQFGIPKGDKGSAAGFDTPTATATATASGGNPTVMVTASGPDTAKKFEFAFELPRGDVGENAEIVGATASVDNTQGNPQVVVTMGGTSAARTFDFAFTGLRGVDGQGAVSSVNGVLPNAAGDVPLIKGVEVVLVVANWVNNEQTIAVDGVIADEEKQHVISGLALDSLEDGANANILAVRQNDGSLTFACSKVPKVDIAMNILLIGGF